MLGSLRRQHDLSVGSFSHSSSSADQAVDTEFHEPSVGWRVTVDLVVTDVRNNNARRDAEDNRRRLRIGRTPRRPNKAGLVRRLKEDTGDAAKHEAALFSGLLGSDVRNLPAADAHNVCGVGTVPVPK